MNINDIDSFELKLIMRDIDKKINTYNLVGITVDEIMNISNLEDTKAFNCYNHKKENDELIYEKNKGIYKYNHKNDHEFSNILTTNIAINNIEKKEISAIGIILKLIYEHFNYKDETSNKISIDIKEEKTEKEQLIYKCAAKLLVPYTEKELDYDATQALILENRKDNSLRKLYIQKLANQYEVSEEIAEIALRNTKPNRAAVSDHYDLSCWNNFTSPKIKIK